MGRRTLIVMFVIAAGMPQLLSPEGRSSMKSFTDPGIVRAGIPLIDENIPARLETATFAMG